MVFKFNDYTDAEKISLIGVYNAKRVKGEIEEDFKIALCFYTVPSKYRESPNDADDIFEWDRSNGFQTATHEFNHYNLSTQPECGTYTYHLTGEPDWATFNVSSDPSVLHTMVITVDETTPIDAAT